MADFVYKPSDWQARFHALPHHEALGAGAAGPGKTEALIHDPLSQVQVEHARMVRDPSLVAEPGHWLYDAVEQNPIEPGQSKGWALFLRRTFPTLEQTVARCKRTFLQMDPGCEWVESKKWFKFSTGYTYQFSHCKDIGDWEQFLSLEFTWIGYDELVQFDKMQYVQINSRLRTSDPVLMQMLRIRAMSNPAQKAESGAKVRDPKWVRDYFVKPHPEGNATIRKTMKRADGSTFHRDRIYLPATLHDNPDKEFVRTYEETLLNLPKALREAYIYGNWWLTTGSHFAEVWNDSLHIVRPFRITPEYRRWRAMDWGLKSFGCVLWFAMNPDGHTFVEREFKFRGKKADEVARDIQEIEKNMGLWRGKRSLISGPADTQLWEERGDVGETKAATFARYGVAWTKAEKTRLTNAQRLFAMLKGHDHGTREPDLMFFQTCRYVIETVQSIQSDPDVPELPVDGGDDHAYDTLCYGLAYASRGRAGIPDHHVNPYDEVERSPLEDEDRGAFGYG